MKYVQIEGIKNYEEIDKMFSHMCKEYGKNPEEVMAKNLHINKEAVLDHFNLCELADYLNCIITIDFGNNTIKLNYDNQDVVPAIYESSGSIPAVEDVVEEKETERNLTSVKTQEPAKIETIEDPKIF